MEAENSKELFEARHEIYKCKNILKSKGRSATIVASHYHFWGLMVRKGFLPKWVFQGEPGESALKLYDILESYIKKRRKNKKRYAENYIWLVSEIRKMR